MYIARILAAALLALAPCLAVAQASFATKQIASRGLDLVATTPAEFTAAIRAEVVTTGEMIKAAGVKPG